MSAIKIKTVTAQVYREIYLRDPPCLGPLVAQQWKDYNGPISQRPRVGRLQV